MALKCRLSLRIIRDVDDFFVEQLVSEASIEAFDGRIFCGLPESIPEI